ncbi:MAG: aminotransferase class V-fold PLP-dependent enzyme [Deltaproteobacteria bacterium]|nr:aminotransferase class V-fold PLP-dependent enzyme [Deltaproteobacteria bacterium]
MAFDLQRVRDDLPSARANAYLNAGTFGPMPRVAAEAMRAHVELSFERGRIGHAGIMRWFGLMDRARVAFAQAISSPADEVALTHCTTDGCNIVVWGLSFTPGDEVVTTSHEHPGLTAPLDELARTKGVVVRVAAPTLEAIVAATGPRTKLVALSHVLWTNGDVLPLAEIVEAVRAKLGDDVFFLVDGAQSVGSIDVSPAALGVDAYTVSGQKWLCGPSGTGALWVRPAALARLATPWPWYLSKQRGPGGIAEWTTARRLDASTIGMTSLAGAIAALEWHHDVWRDGGLAHSARLADRLRARLAETPRIRLLPAAVSSQLVSFVVEGESASSVAQRLEAAQILVRSIPDADCLRASVGFWNDEADIERLVAAV